MNNKIFILIIVLGLMVSAPIAHAEEEPHPVDEWIKAQQVKIDQDRQRIEAAEMAKENNKAPSSKQAPAEKKTSSRMPEKTPPKRLIYKKPESKTGKRMWQ